MIVWGGYGYLNTGGRYNPSTNSWASVTAFGAPSGRNYHTAIWTGDRMIVWGGHTYIPEYQQFGTGGRYDPVSNSWTPTYSPGAPEGRAYLPAVWTGNEMIVWGGGFWTGGDGLYIEAVDTGGRYSPVTDSWTPTSSVNAPEPRYDHSAVWSVDYVVVWGGTNYNDELDTGGRYYPVGDQWGATSLVDAPIERSGHTAVWTGDEMIVWGGTTSAPGGRYDPLADVWSSVSSVGAPSYRSNHSVVWTGDEMIVWGGYGDGHELDTGGRYAPVSDSWTPTSTVDTPPARYRHSAVWTGDEMIVWGGNDEPFSETDTGGRYFPETDQWLPTSGADAPSARQGHDAVWIANEMIVWGGYDGGDPLDTGGRYSPLGDSWSPTSIADVAHPRSEHATVAAGDKMMVWGGIGPRDDGGRYYPNGVDGDGDGHGCGVDCDDADPGAFAPPDEVEGLRFGEDGESLQWVSAATTAGDGTVYDIARGVVSELPVGGGPSETCAESNYAPGTAEMV
jgi:N-acetylneuraminic acid mutarotase